MFRLLTATIALSLAAQPGGLTVYSNGRFGFRVAYPTAVLLPQGEPANGDGQRFVSKDKSFTMFAWGGFNALEQAIPASCQWHIDLESKGHPFKVTYKVVKDSWYVYSGLSGANIVYQKSLLRDGVFTTLRLEYPFADKDKWDSAVKQIVASLAGPSGKP